MLCFICLIWLTQLIPKSGVHLIRVQKLGVTITSSSAFLLQVALGPAAVVKRFNQLLSDLDRAETEMLQALGVPQKQPVCL